MSTQSPPNPSNSKSTTNAGSSTKAPKKSLKWSRRFFLKGASLGILGGATTLGFLSPLILRRKSQLLRPPGALEESVFLASCIKCGQCLQVCPPKAIDLAGLDQGFGIGTPYITPRTEACILCSGLPCVLACPTGALDHDIVEGKEAKMGLAVLTHPETCLSLRGENDLLHRLERIRKEVKEQNEVQKSSKAMRTQKIGPLDSEIKTNIGQLIESSLLRLNGKDLEAWGAQFQIALPTNTDPKKEDKARRKALLESLPEKLVEELESSVNFGSPQEGSSWDWLEKTLLNSAISKNSCRVCLEECPIEGEAPIKFVEIPNRGTQAKAFEPQVQASCVGCGVCEMKCPTKISSIEITSRLRVSEAKA